MSLYYEDEWVQLHLGDARLIRGWLLADVLITDPPYGTSLGQYGKNHRGGYGRRDKYDKGDGVSFTIANDDTTECRDTALDLWGDRPALVFGSPRQPDPPGQWDDRLVWDKKRIGINGGPWRYQHESIFVRGFQRTTADASSVLTAFPSEQWMHVHAKPVALMEHLIERAPAGVVADPFAGSGSTLIAARNLGRRSIGVELDPEYCALIVRRLGQQAFDFSALQPQPLPGLEPSQLEGWDG